MRFWMDVWMVERPQDVTRTFSAGVKYPIRNQKQEHPRSHYSSSFTFTLIEFSIWGRISERLASVLWSHWVFRGFRAKFRSTTKAAFTRIIRYNRSPSEISQFDRCGQIILLRRKKSRTRDSQPTRSFCLSNRSTRGLPRFRRMESWDLWRFVDVLLVECIETFKLRLCSLACHRVR